jgi:protein phosphatase PTC7
MSDAGYNSGDTIAMGQNVQQKLREGDIVLVATDGLYDNLPVKDIVARTAKLDDVDEIADMLADIATENQLNKNYQSPFQISAEKAGQEWQGGKEDDLTIVVAKVVQTGPDHTPTTLLSTLSTDDLPEV